MELCILIRETSSSTESSKLGLFLPLGLMASICIAFGAVRGWWWVVVVVGWVCCLWGSFLVEKLPSVYPSASIGQDGMGWWWVCGGGFFGSYLLVLLNPWYKCIRHAWLTVEQVIRCRKCRWSDRIKEIPFISVWLYADTVVHAGRACWYANLTYVQG